MPRPEPGDRPHPGDESPAPRPARLPGFLLDEDVGLGTAFKRVTSAFGVRPCGGCERRAAALDRWLVLGGRRKG